MALQECVYTLFYIHNIKDQKIQLLYILISVQCLHYGFDHPSHCVYSFNIYNRAVDEKKVMFFHGYRDIITRTWKLIIESNFSWYFPKLSTKISFFPFICECCKHTYIQGSNMRNKATLLFRKILFSPLPNSRKLKSKNTRWRIKNIIYNNDYWLLIWHKQAYV